MESIIKKVLKKIEKNGYECYAVGGYVRDFLLDRKTYDIDICTNATPDEIKEIFKTNEKDNFGSVSIKIKKYNIDITTYREDVKYEKRKPIELKYLDNLEDDLKRRDFTINTLCMDRFNNIIDIFDGINDINNKKIKVVGDVNKKIKEDPLRILRGIRFATTLDFLIDDKLDKCIKSNYELVKELSDYRIREELTKILESKNFLKGLELLKKYKILDLLEINYNEISYKKDVLEMWAQLDFKHNYGFTKSELSNIIEIRKKRNE